MEKYEFLISETRYATIEIEAESVDEAFEKADALADSGEYEIEPERAYVEVLMLD